MKVLKKKVLDLLKNRDFKEVASNSVYLYLIQGLNYIVPLITMPYLIRVLGIESFGTVVFVTATMSYFSAVTDYGFNITATREISITSSKKEVSVIFHSIYCIKVCALILCALILGIILFLFSDNEKLTLLYMTAFLMVIGEAFIPIWFFQGVKKMQLITVVNFIAKIVGAILIFTTVKDESDLINAVFSNSIGYVIAACVAMWLVYYKEKLTFLIPPKSRIKQQLSVGWPVFISNVFVRLYVSTNTLILGLLCGDSEVGRFGAVEKVLRAFSALGGAFVTALYPNLAQIYERNYQSYKKILRSTVLGIGLVFLLFSIVNVSFAQTIVFILTGSRDPVMVTYLSVASIAVLFLPYGPIFTNAIVIQGHAKKLTRFTMLGAILDFLLIFPLIHFFGGLGAVITVGSVYFLISTIKGRFVWSINHVKSANE